MQEETKSNPLRTQPDYGERELYDDIIHISSIVNSLYCKQINDKHIISKFEDFLHKFDYDKMFKFEYDHISLNGSKRLKCKRNNF